jgi:GH25 family lysozyme M1 (1,4-beta-N-acetylmuramidase)
VAINCIDISTWNNNVNYRAVRSDGISAAILRAGFGREVSQIDSQFENHYKGCRDAGLKIGIYWYSYADSVSDAETEARACLAILNGRHIDLPVYFDMEEAWQTSVGMQTLTAMAERFCETIKQGGYKAGVYSNLNWFYNYLDYDRLRSKYSIWLAQWSGSYSLACDIWQNSETGDINGINGNCDTNVILNWDIM